MDPILSHPIPDPERPAEEMLEELMALDESLERRLFAGSESARARYETLLVPKLEEAIALVERQSTLAKNAILDAILLYREALAGSLQ